MSIFYWKTPWSWRWQKICLAMMARERGTISPDDKWYTLGLEKERGPMRADRREKEEEDIIYTCVTPKPADEKSHCVRPSFDACFPDEAAGRYTVGMKAIRSTLLKGYQHQCLIVSHIDEKWMYIIFTSQSQLWQWMLTAISLAETMYLSLLCSLTSWHLPFWLMHVFTDHYFMLYMESWSWLG